MNNNLEPNYPATPKEICAIIATYKPNSDLYLHLNNVTKQVGYTVIVDDSGNPVTRHELDSQLSCRQNTAVLHNDSNRGLAASLNRGIIEAKCLGFKWILTLDDDTLIEPDMCDQLVRGWPVISKSIPIGILAMSWRTSVSSCTEQSIAYRRKTMVITSGSLMSMSTFDSVGPFREEFIIDAVDADYCLRVRAQGLGVIEIATRGFTQRVGFPRTLELGPLRLMLQEHAPLRTYYRVRNSAALVLKWWHREPRYATGCVFCDLQQLLAIALFYENKMEHLIAMADGLVDARAGIYGFRTRKTLHRSAMI